MSQNNPEALRALADAARAAAPKSEPISLSEAYQVIRDHAAAQCSPAVAALLRRLVVAHAAGVLPRSLLVNVCDVGREMRSAAREAEQ